MATNAPYYQLRGQFTNGTNDALPTTTDDDYDLSPQLAPHHASVHSDTPMPDNHAVALEENHNFVELLEAATTAAGQAAKAMTLEGQLPGSAQQHTGKRKRVSSPSEESAGCSSVHDNTQSEASISHKRARTDIPTDPRLHVSNDNAQNASGSNPTPSGHMLLNDARAAGVHSAAALFRRSSKEPARKYTRPPMSKLFMSLQLTPENFLQLQAQAKAYMLHPAHPNRQSCVGNRGKGDTDLVKLKLFNCVREFLSDGAGEQFFGEDVEKPAEKEALEAARALGEEGPTMEPKLVWPRDGNKIISLVTPLLRRMVTNERQRMYAIETRKGGAKKKEGSVDSSQTPDNDGAAMEGTGHPREELQVASHSRLPITVPTQNQQSHPAPRVFSATNQHLPMVNQDLPSQLSPILNHPSNMAEDQPVEMFVLGSRVKERDLPTAEDRVFELRKINLFLSKDDLKLKQKDQIIGPGPLIEYSWGLLQRRITAQIKLAVAMYPQLREQYQKSITSEEIDQKLRGMGPEALRGLAVAATEIENHGTHANSLEPELNIHAINNPPSSPVVTSLPSSTTIRSSLSIPPISALPTPPQARSHDGSSTFVDAPESLTSNPAEPPDEAASTRALAPSPQPSLNPAALLEEVPVQAEVASLAAPQPAPQPTPQRAYSSDAVQAASPQPGSDVEERLPSYVVKAMLTRGLSVVKDAQDWENAKLEIGYAVWANGKLSIVVELM